MEKQIRIIFEEFNYMVNNLIKSFTRTNLDEDSLIFLSKRTKHLLSFTHKILIKIVFKFFGGLNLVKYKVNEDIIDIDKMVDIIIEQINLSLDDLISQKVNGKRKEDVDTIVDYLIILKNIINKLGKFILSVIKFQADIIDDNEFRKDYRTFKYDIVEEKNVIDEKFNINL